MFTKKTFLILFLMVTILCLYSIADEIHEASKAGDIDKIEALLAVDITALNAVDAEKMTPLHHATAARQLEAAALLLKHGAEVDAVNFRGETPLHISAVAGNYELTKLLLANGADVTLRNFRTRIPLFLAANGGGDLDTVKALIDAGSDVNDRNARDEIVLLSTLMWVDKEIIYLLLDHGATIPSEIPLLRRALRNSALKGLGRAFILAVELSKNIGYEWWQDISMHSCASGGSVAIAEQLLEKGIPITGVNIHGVEPLHIAAEQGQAEMIDYLLSRGAQIDRTCPNGKTALHFAQDNDHHAVAELLISKGASQEKPKFPILKGDYLGQTVPGDSPQPFALGIVSVHDMNSEHSPTVFSPDGNEAFWTAMFRGPILQMKRTDGIWSAPAPASFNSEFGEGEPLFSTDGKKIFFLSMRPLTSGGEKEAENIWFVEKTASGWGQAKPLPAAINDFQQHWSFSIAADGSIYFASVNQNGYGAQDIYVSRFENGKYLEPENLGEVINGSGIDHTPHIAPDQSYLIYATTGDKTGMPNLRFRISFRDKNGAWMKPVKLSDELESIGSGLCPVITPDEKYLFFVNGDVFWVDAGFIEKLRPASN